MKRAHGLHLVLQNWLNNNFFRRVEKGIRFPDLLPVETPQNTEHFAKNYYKNKYFFCYHNHPTA